MVGRIIPFLILFASCSVKEDDVRDLPQIKYGEHPRNVMDFKYVSPTCYLFIHGGAWAVGDKSDWHRMDKIVCPKGYSYAAMNYRLSNETDWRGMDEDVTRAIECLKSLGIKRVVLCGMSAGSMIALVHASHGDVDGVITWGTISDNTMDICNGLVPYANKYGQMSVRDSVFKMPITVIHGLKDDVTYLAQSIALAKKGAIFVGYPQYGHGLSEMELYQIFDKVIK